MVELMFPFITKKWSPVIGCNHGCIYCYARNLACTRLKNLPKYKDGFKPAIDIKTLEECDFKKDDFVFVSDMGDLFCKAVPDDWISAVFEKVKQSPARFLFLTKNPSRYAGMVVGRQNFMPTNAVYGATVESDIYYPQVSGAQTPKVRLAFMSFLSSYSGLRTFISIEPIMKFTSNFKVWLETIKPWGVAVGFDNWGNKLPEPTLKETEDLISYLTPFTQVYRKTIREAWDYAG